MRRATVVVPRKEVCKHCCSSSDTCIVVIIKGETQLKAFSSLLWVISRPSIIGNNVQYHTFHLVMAVLRFELRLPCYSPSVASHSYNYVRYANWQLFPKTVCHYKAVYFVGIAESTFAKKLFSLGIGTAHSIKMSFKNFSSSLCAYSVKL